jgi:guanylate kinase
VDYFFLSREDFQRHIDDGAFVEWADYAGQRYGTLRREVERIWGEGRAVLLDIEVQGTAQVREKYPPPESLAIFLLPPSGQELVNRIRGRGTESHAAGWLPRLERACVELEDAGLFDQVVVNDNLEQAVADVSAAIDGRRAGGMRPEDRQRVARLIDELRTLLAELKRTETRGLI